MRKLAIFFTMVLFTVGIVNATDLGCVGDSLTGTSYSYCNKINDTPAYTTFNEGISGDTTADILARMDDLLGESFKEIIILAGTSDLRVSEGISDNQYYLNLLNITQQLLDDNFTNIVISDIPPCDDFESSGGDRDCRIGKVKEFQSIVKRVSYEKNIKYCNIFDDVFGGDFDPGQFVDARLHPDDQAHAEMNSTYIACLASGTSFDCDAYPGECYAFTEAPSCDSGMVSYWKMENTTGFVIDSWGHNYGINDGAARGVTGQVGSSFDFDGTTDYVNVSDIMYYDLNTATQGTIMAWIYSELDDVTDGVIFNVDNSTATTDFFNFFIDNGKLVARLKVGGVWQWSLTTDSLIDDYQKWIHVAIVQNGTDPVLYINGTKPAQSYTIDVDRTAWFDDLNGADLAQIGVYNNAGSPVKYFDGKIDEVAVFNTPLSSSTISLDYNYGLEGQDYCYSESGGPGPGYAIPEFSSVGLVLIVAMFALLLVYRNKKSS